MPHPPHTSTPKNNYLPRRLKESARERKFVQNKKFCDQGTQTDFELYLPEIEKMENIIRDLCDKIETLESQLKSKQTETSSTSDSFELMSVLSAEYSESDTRKSHKRKRNRSSTNDFVSNNIFIGFLKNLFFLSLWYC